MTSPSPAQPDAASTPRGPRARRVSQRIGAICVTHQRETFVPVDNEGDPLRNGILWLDERSRMQLAALDRQFGGDALHSLTGRPPSMTQSLPKLVWLTEHEPDVIRKASLHRGPTRNVL